MGNQGEKTTLPRIVQKIKLSSCSKVSKSRQDLLININYSKKVLLVRRENPNDVQIVKEFVMEKQLEPTSNEAAFNSLYFGDNKGCLYFNDLTSKILRKQKISDFRIDHIKAMGQCLLVSQNKFLNLMRVSKQHAMTIKKIGQLKENVNSMLPLNDLEVAIGSDSFIKIYDVEKSRSVHQYHLLTPTNVLFPYETQPPYNYFVGAGLGKSLYSYDKRTGTPQSLGMLQIADISAGLLYKGMLLLGGQSGKLQILLPKGSKPICLEGQHTGRIIGIVESGDKIVSVCQGGNINFMQV